MDDEKLISTDSLSVNNLVIDAQHQQLFDLCGELADKKAANDSAEYARLLSALTDFFLDHFSTEEALMLQYGYPELEKHKLEHNKFIYRISMFNVEFKRTVPTKSMEVHKFICFWLTEHVMKLDMEYRDFLLWKSRNMAV